MRVDWSKPTISYVYEGNYSFEEEMNVFEINEKDKWTFWVIQTVQGDPVNCLVRFIFTHTTFT